MSEHRCTLLINNKRGLHARASAKLAQLASQFPCSVQLGRDPDRLCNAKNILEVMMLAASPGTTLHVHAQGEHAANAINALQDLAKRNFEEDA